MLINRYARYLLFVLMVSTSFMLGACNAANNGSEADQSDISLYNSAYSISFDSYEQGDESGFILDEYALDEPTMFVIRTQEDLDAFWSIHSAIFFPQPDVPQIDFTQDMLIAVVDTVQPTGGYALNIVDIVSSEGTVSVEVEKVSPGPDCLVTDALTIPYHIIILPQTDMEFILQIIE